MTRILVDSCVLLDVATRDPAWESWSRSALEAAHDRSLVVINPVVYGELSVGFPTIEAVDAALPIDLYLREPIPYSAAFLAGRCYRDYRRQGGTKRSPLPDFYIGAHAVVSGYRLLTRDVARYRTYFPKLELIAPA